MQSARRTPKWFARGVVYQIQPRSFTPEGTLKAAEARLPYLRDLGATIAYLVPVMRMDRDMDRRFWSPRQIRSGFDNPANQYRIADYFHVDPEYGSDRDLADFCAAAHRLGMHVVLDLVYLPTPLLKKAAERKMKHCDGSEMLLRQGAASFRYWTGVEPPVEAMRRGMAEDPSSTPAFDWRTTA